MELRVAAADGGDLPEGYIVSVRVGAVQKQAPFSAKKPYRFDKVRRSAKIEIYRPVGVCDFNWSATEDPEVRQIECRSVGASGGTRNPRCPMLRVYARRTGLIGGPGRSDCVNGGAVDTGEVNNAVSTESADGQAGGDCGDTAATEPHKVGKGSAMRQQLKERSRGYLKQHGVEELLTCAMRALLETMPEDATQFLAEFISASRKKAPMLAPPPTASPEYYRTYVLPGSCLLDCERLYTQFPPVSRTPHAVIPAAPVFDRSAASIEAGSCGSDPVHGVAVEAVRWPRRWHLWPSMGGAFGPKLRILAEPGVTAVAAAYVPSTQTASASSGPPSEGRLAASAHAAFAHIHCASDPATKTLHGRSRDASRERSVHASNDGGGSRCGSRGPTTRGRSPAVRIPAASSASGSEHVPRGRTHERASAGDGSSRGNKRSTSRPPASRTCTQACDSSRSSNRQPAARGSTCDGAAVSAIAGGNGISKELPTEAAAKLPSAAVVAGMANVEPATAPVSRRCTGFRHIPSVGSWFGSASRPQPQPPEPKQACGNTSDSIDLAAEKLRRCLERASCDGSLVAVLRSARLADFGSGRPINEPTSAAPPAGRWRRRQFWPSMGGAFGPQLRILAPPGVTATPAVFSTQKKPAPSASSAPPSEACIKLKECLEAAVRDGSLKRFTQALETR
eukprot:TRINITY_DN10555_c0_g1_i1.p1 TRINITY_DN10555_c0_g1~~TRINITY_DN10555_c0_g1_i1.p1  ORF type:complete len:678 (-),score=113.27 TRINITY_DN10555_c0_g1_i1:35-2068(-)